MNILHKLTLRSLFRNKTRTLVTIIGVILSAAMITAVTTCISSLQGYMYNNVVYQSGDWHGVYYSMDSEQLAQLQASDAVELSYAAQVLGYAELESGINEDKPYLYLLAGDADFFQHMPVHVTAGRLPQNADEILIPQHVSENGGVRFTLGSSITLAVGQRVLREGTAYDDMPRQQYNPYQQDEELLVQTQRSYTIVGFYERPDFEDYSAPGYTALTCMEAADTAGTSYDGYFRLNNPREIYSDSLFDGQFSALASSINRDLLIMSGYSRYDSFYRVVYSLAAILIGLIMFGSISLIYNAFAISVSERTRQFGLLSSVGATRRQIRRSVFFEAFVVSLVGIPLGILSGILGIGVTLHYVGGKFGSFFGSSGIDFSLQVSVAAVIIAAIVALVTVLISAWVPSKRAMRISAIEAIRQSNDISIKAKKVRTSKLTYKLFGLEGMIARKHFKRNRKKYRATVVSLFMSIVLFISASSFCTYMTDAVSGVFETYDYDIQYYAIDNSKEEEAEIFALLCSAEGVTQSNWYYSRGFVIEVPVDLLSAEAQQAFTLPGDDTASLSVQVYGVEDDVYRAYLRAHNLDESQFLDSANPQGITLASMNIFSYTAQKFEDIPLFAQPQFSLTMRSLNDAKYNEYWESEAFQQLDAEEQNRLIEENCYDEVPLTIGYLADALPFGLNSARITSLRIVYPMSYFVQLFPGYSTTIFCFKTNDHAAVHSAMSQLLSEQNLDVSNLFDIYSMDEAERNLVLIVKVFSYGFITLISLIAVANVFNTISTNIMLRRREFAMLKSVGMTRRGFNRMMNFECLLYGFKALLLGIPVSFGVTWLIFESVGMGIDTDFYLPWGAVLIAVCSVFAVVFATMLYAMRKIKKDNVIDALKNENL